MKQRRVVTTPEADVDATRIDQWWVQNRGAAPNLFVEELADAIALLGLEAGVGVRHAHGQFRVFVGTSCARRDTTCTSSTVMSSW